MFTIPHRLPRLNEYIRHERGSKYLAAKIKKKYTGLCMAYIPRLRFDKRPIEITYVWAVKNIANDPGNVSFGNKFIEDAMVISGFIPDDNLKWIKKITHKFLLQEKEGVTVIAAEVAE